MAGIEEGRPRPGRALFARAPAAAARDRDKWSGRRWWRSGPSISTRCVQPSMPPNISRTLVEEAGADIDTLEPGEIGGDRRTNRERRVIRHRLDGADHELIVDGKPDPHLVDGGPGRDRPAIAGVRNHRFSHRSGAPRCPTARRRGESRCRRHGGCGPASRGSGDEKRHDQRHPRGVKRSSLEAAGRLGKRFCRLGRQESRSTPAGTSRLMKAWPMSRTSISVIWPSRTFLSRCMWAIRRSAAKPARWQWRRAPRGGPTAVKCRRTRAAAAGGQRP